MINLRAIQFWAIIVIMICSIANLAISITNNSNHTKVNIPTAISFGDSGSWGASNQPEWLKTPAWLPRENKSTVYNRHISIGAVDFYVTE